jgi:hypothetical protein
MSWTNPARSFFNVGRWFGGRGSPTEMTWVIDRRDGERWVEYGRRSSRHEAEETVARLVSEGRGDAATYRVSDRPADADGSYLVLRWVLLGFVVCAGLAFLLSVVLR